MPGSPQSVSTPYLTSHSQSRAQSRSRSRRRGSHDHAAHSAAYLPSAPDGLLLPEDSSITEENLELLREFVHPRHHDKRRAETEDTLVAESTAQVQVNDVTSEIDGDEVDNEDEDWEALKKRPWYRRPSPYWLLLTTPFSSIAMSACAAPRVEIYTLLACRQHKPEYNAGELHRNTDVYMNDIVPIATDADNLITPLLNDSKKSLLDLGLILLPPPEDVATGILQESKETNKCASDPVVQAAAAKIIATLTTTMGILSCLTTAFWGSLSDRFGRLRVLSISVLGLLFSDVIFISVFFFSAQLPGGYWFLLLGPIVEGLLGGLTSVVAAVHAYIADVSHPGDRSRQFSLGAGLLFVGVAFGPSLGSLLVYLTGTPITVFYLATGVHVLMATYVWTVVPESLPKRTQKANRLRAEHRRLEETRAEERETQEQLLNDRIMWKIVCEGMLGRAKRIFSFLSPLSVFAPVKLDGHKRRDWSLMLIAASHGFSAFVIASYQFKFQYAAATFGWSSEELGYWLSLVGGSRALYLTLILPMIIKLFNRPKQAIQLPVEHDEPLVIDRAASEPLSSTIIESSFPSPPLERAQKPLEDPRRVSTSASISSSPPAIAPHSANFDLHLARFSLAWEAICLAIIPLVPSAFVFSVVGCMAAWGGGFGPAVQALALELYARRIAVLRNTEDQMETGRLFGAMSVVQAMCSQIFGPTLFGLVYVKTVDYFPTAIFWVSTLCITIALMCILLVRLPRDTAAHIHGVGHPSEVDLEDPPELQRLDHEVTLVDIRDDLDADAQLRIRGEGSAKKSR